MKWLFYLVLLLLLSRRLLRYLRKCRPPCSEIATILSDASEFLLFGRLFWVSVSAERTVSTLIAICQFNDGLC